MRGLPCVKGAVSRRLTEGLAKAFLSNRVLSKHPALSIPPSRLRRATSLYAREASSGGGAPSSVPGYARSTFPVGEGDLRRGLFISVRPGPVGVPSTPAAYGRHPLQAGEGRDFLRRGRSLTFPWGKVPPQRRMRGGARSVLPAVPLPSGLRPATLSQERVWPLIRPVLRPVHLPRRGRLPPAGESKGTPPPGRGRRLRNWRTWGRWGYSLRRRRRK